MTDHPHAFDVPEGDSQAFGLLAHHVVLDLTTQSHHVALLRGLYANKEATFVCLKSPVGEDSTGLVPIAILLDVDDVLKDISIRFNKDGVAPPMLATAEIDFDTGGMRLSNIQPEGF